MAATTSLIPKTIADDPLKVQIYTLRNGMTLFLSVNPEEPRIHTNIIVRAGSKQDPADATGLAHYMEHMLFKGTSRIGALDWAQESKFLEQISDLYEQHRVTQDPEVRRKIYQNIDRLSSEAARLVAPNEYDLLSGAIGAKDTNAYTSVDQTVYINDIPSNELKRWMRLESERFRMMALRLFHTELETVYEEFNIGQDQDNRKVNRLIREALFPNHPYGTQTTIGSAGTCATLPKRKSRLFSRPIMCQTIWRLSFPAILSRSRQWLWLKRTSACMSPVRSPRSATNRHRRFRSRSAWRPGDRKRPLWISPGVSRGLLLMIP